jgi:hypothetical protein
VAPSKRGVWIGALTGLAIVAGIGVIVSFAMSGGGGGDAKKKAEGAQVAGAGSMMTVVPIEEPAQQAGSADTGSSSGSAAAAPEIAPEPAAPQPPPKKQKHSPRPHGDKPHGDHVKAQPTTTTPPVEHDKLTKDAVAARFHAVSRAYEEYKVKNGGRLDGEWNDLTMFMQYHLNENLEEANRRIEAFRVKLRE